MELQLNTLLDFCREPMLALEGDTLSHLNAAARALFPNLTPGCSAVGTLPDYILFDPTAQSVTSAVLAGQTFTVFSMRFDQMSVHSFRAERTADRSLISDGMMSVLSTALFNVGLSMRQLAKRSDLSAPELRRYFTLLQHNYHLLERQFANLGMALQLKEKNVLLRPRRCNLVALCRELASAVSSLGEGELAGLEFLSEFDALDACVDPDLTAQMLLNLLSNSFRHCTPAGTVHLRLEKKGERVFLSVDDDGSGIPDEVLQNVFTRYEDRIRPNALTEPLSGGLGLGIARGIAELHGGALIIESKPGRGTSVRVMLPLEQPGSDILEDAQDPPYFVNLDTLLTELSDVLRAKCYECEFDD